MNTLLQERRQRIPLTQAELARRMGVAEISIRRWEAGSRPQPTYIRKLCEVLNASPQELGLLPATLGTSVHSLPIESTTSPVSTSQHAWLVARSQLNTFRRELTQLATDLYPPGQRIERTGTLMAGSWRFPAPMDLASIDLTFDDQPLPSVTGRHQETLRLRPLRSPGRHFETYHHAMRDLAPPRLFENRVCYRLLGVGRQGHDRCQLTLGYMRYFDMIDVGEAVAHELAMVSIDEHGDLRRDQGTWDRLPFRRLIGHPFDLSAYPLLLSVSTLTIRRSKAATTFLLLRRGVERVAIAGGMLSVFPTGVFQPASILPRANSDDLNLWYNIMREYSEEFLGSPEHDGSGNPIDYLSDEPFRSLSAARASGRLRIYCLGVGIDALNLVGDVLTVAIFEDDAFDTIFRRMVDQNDEGTIVDSGRNRQQFSFDESTIEDLLRTEAMAPSGAACLHLAWHHRQIILG